MQRLVLSVLVLLAIECRAQVPDYPDYRTKKESFLKVSDKAIRADLSTFTFAGIEESISKLPLAKMPVKSWNNNYMSFENDQVRVVIEMVPFDAKGRKLQKVEDNIVKIDGKAFYGAYGFMPQSAIKQIIVIIGKDTVPLPREAYFDIYDLKLTYKEGANTAKSANAVFFSTDKRTFYIYVLNRNGNQSFEITWIIQDKKYLRRVLDYGI